MNIEDNDIMHCLEWPPTKHNFSLYNIIEFILIFVFGCYGGYQVYKIFRFGTYELTDWLGLIIYGMIFLGACLSFFGLLEDTTTSYTTIEKDITSTTNTTQITFPKSIHTDFTKTTNIDITIIPISNSFSFSYSIYDLTNIFSIF